MRRLDSSMWKYLLFILFLIVPYSYGQFCSDNRYNPNQQTGSSSCFSWGNSHVKSYDDNGFSYKSDCKFTMSQFHTGTSQFQLFVSKNSFCSDNCYTTTQVFHGKDIYSFDLDENGKPICRTPTQSYSLPSDLPGLSCYKRGNRAFFNFTEIGVTVAWDMKVIVELIVDNSRGYKCSGLCGNNDRCSSNDLQLQSGSSSSSLDQFLKDWQTGWYICSGGISTQSPCNAASLQKAQSACQVLKNPQKFGQANQVVNPEPYINACIWSYCSCKNPNPTDCICDTLDAYAKASVSAGVTRVSWRDSQLCYIECAGDLRFQSCAPKGGVRVCGDSGPSDVVEKCEEGCYCLANNFLFNGKCYLKKNCPCQWRGKIIQPDETVPDDCNTCTCRNGKMECTDNPCTNGKCHGDPHCTTFDGKKFDFMGRCVYYLVKGSDFSIESDNYGLHNGQFLKNYTEGPSYVRGVFIRMGGYVVELKANLIVEVDKVRIHRFPHKAGPITLTKPSDALILAVLSNNIHVEWNGIWTVNVRLPRSMEGKVMGLLGTFSGDQEDDFMTPDGEIVENPAVFGNSWKTDYSCGDQPITPIEHPCIANPGVKAAAEKACSIIKSQEFRKCMTTDPETDYENCVYDACYFKENIHQSYCESIAGSADECSRKGVSLNWREKLPECNVKCPAGLEYQLCGSECGRTCEDIALRPNCAPVCVAGCNCPAGKTLNEDGVCIPVTECKCRIQEIIFPPGFECLKNIEEMISCGKGKWTIIVPNEDQIEHVPKLEDLNKKCAAIPHSLYTPCKYPAPLTCENMHNYEIRSIPKCEEGCQCIVGYVWDTVSQRCVQPEECPCYNKGQSHIEGSVTKIDSCPKCVCKGKSWDCSACCSPENSIKVDGCQTCVCDGGIWKCSDKNCPSNKCFNENEVKITLNGKCVCKRGVWKCAKAQCDVWGDSHIKTFDHVHYEFKGECSYTLVQGELNGYEFHVIISNEKCSHAGDTCLKSVIVKTVSKGVTESITLIKNGLLPDTKANNLLLLTDYVGFVTIDIIEVGIQIYWDKKTWVYVQIDNSWQNHVMGLCGNFNEVQNDDLMINGKIITVEEAHIFVSLWKTECTTGPKINTCSIERVQWANTRCNILLSDIFADCHYRVPVANYYQACVLDACKCEAAGDCQYLCTAVSAYARQCNNYGISVNWRSRDLCPVKCMGHTHHQTCMKLCAPRTCDLLQRNITLDCQEEICVEGCGPRILPEGYVYSVSTYDKYIPESACIAPRCIVNGNIYYDQDIISMSQCKLRYCSYGKEKCVSLPNCPGGGCSCSCPEC